MLRLLRLVQIVHEFIHFSDLTFHIAHSGPANGELILFLHGFPENWLAWKKQLLFFGGKGFKAVAVDQRGYNLSSKPKFVYNYRIDLLAVDIYKIVKFFHRKKVILVGHDWGANVAWWTALRFPQLIQKLVIINVPHPLVMKKMMNTNFRQTKSSWYIYFFQIPIIPEFLLSMRKSFLLSVLMTSSAKKNSLKRSLLSYYRHSWNYSSIHSMINWYRGMKLGSDKKLSSIKVKPDVIILWGLKDSFIRSENIKPTINLCENPRTIIFKYNTHWLIHEAPEKVNTAIFNFLQK